MLFDADATTKQAESEDKFQLLPDGDYDAEVLECEEQTSKKGDPMFKLTLGIIDPATGFKCKVWDYISPRWFARKFRAFFDSMGQSELYQTGNIDPALLINQYVTATIRTQPAEGQYSEKNVVEMYVLAEVSAAKKMAATTPEKKADDSGLPF